MDEQMKIRRVWFTARESTSCYQFTDDGYRKVPRINYLTDFRVVLRKLVSNSVRCILIADVAIAYKFRIFWKVLDDADTMCSRYDQFAVWIEYIDITYGEQNLWFTYRSLFVLPTASIISFLVQDILISISNRKKKEGKSTSFMKRLLLNLISLLLLIGVWIYTDSHLYKECASQTSTKILAQVLTIPLLGLTWRYGLIGRFLDLSFGFLSSIFLYLTFSAVGPPESEAYLTYEVENNVMIQKLLESIRGSWGVYLILAGFLLICCAFERIITEFCTKNRFVAFKGVVLLLLCVYSACVLFIEGCHCLTSPVENISSMGNWTSGTHPCRDATNMEHLNSILALTLVCAMNLLDLAGNEPATSTMLEQVLPEAFSWQSAKTMDRKAIIVFETQTSSIQTDINYLTQSWKLKGLKVTRASPIQNTILHDLNRIHQFAENSRNVCFQYLKAEKYPSIRQTSSSIDVQPFIRRCDTNSLEEGQLVHGQYDVEHANGSSVQVLFITSSQPSDCEVAQLQAF